MTPISMNQFICVLRYKNGNLLYKKNKLQLRHISSVKTVTVPFVGVFFFLTVYGRYGRKRFILTGWVYQLVIYVKSYLWMKNLE